MPSQRKTAYIPRVASLVKPWSGRLRCTPSGWPQINRMRTIIMSQHGSLIACLNAGTSARGFDVSWVDPSDAYRRDDLRVTALYETLTTAGEVRLHAGKAALNLTLAGLDLDLEDRQIAAEAVLRAQIESGRWSQAEQTATATHADRCGVIAAISTNILRSVERDLRDTDWEEDVESALDKSLMHVADRVTVSYQLSDHAQQLAEDIDPEHRMQAASVVRLVRDTLTQLLTLQRRVIDARDRFRPLR